MTQEKPSSWLPPSLSSQRLVLRALAEADAPAIHAYSKNPQLSELMTWAPHASPEASLAFLRDIVFPAYQRGIPRALGITLKQDPSRVIGSIGADWVSEKDRCMSLGYVLGQEHWGQGLMPEAIAAFVGYLFGAFPVDRIQATCMLENSRSASALKKVGMAYEGTLRASAMVKGQLRDMQVYSVLRRDWPFEKTLRT